MGVTAPLYEPDVSAGYVAGRQSIIDAARTRTGHDDLGTGWEEGFDRILRELDRLDLDPTHAARSARKLGTFLDARLHAEQGWKAYPEFNAEPIRQPVIIAGLVRSGTTALHKLLSIDPQFQAPEHWLTLAPMPRPPRERWASVPEYRRLAGYLDEQLGNAPGLKEHHNQAVDDAEESIYLLAQNFTNNMFPSLWDMPDYDRWYQQQDETPNYRRLADALRLIGHREPDRRWLLKNPTDLFAMDAVLTALPDALVIQTHRDPVQAIPSICGLMQTARYAMSGKVDSERLGERESRFYAEAVRRAAQARRRTPGQFMDVDFREFVADQLGTVRAIYERFGLTLQSEVEARMKAWLDANPRTSGTMQRIEPEAFGLTADGLARQYGEYRAALGYV